MEKSKKILAAVATGAVLLGLGASTWAASTGNGSCVTVYVDYGVLKDHQVQQSCVAVSGNTRAPEVLRLAGLALTGTKKYGDQIVCRVNDLPSATAPVPVRGHEDYVEPCADMPAEFAYWAVLVKRGGANPLDLSTRWGWAETGVRDVVLKPGDSVGLVFADNDNVRFPK